MTLTKDEQHLLKASMRVRHALIQHGQEELAKIIDDMFITPLTKKLKGIQND